MNTLSVLSISVNMLVLAVCVLILARLTDMQRLYTHRRIAQQQSYFYEVSWGEVARVIRAMRKGGHTLRNIKGGDQVAYLEFV